MCLVGPGMYDEAVSNHFYRHRVSQKSDCDHFFVDNLPIFQDMANYQTKMVEKWFFGTPFGGKNCWTQLQHTFLDQSNTLNYALKLSVELRSEHFFQNMANYQTKMVKIWFFGTPYNGKNGWKQLQHTFLDQPNTFCFVNFALKLSAELRSDQKRGHSKGKICILIIFHHMNIYFSTLNMSFKGVYQLL